MACLLREVALECDDRTRVEFAPPLAVILDVLDHNENRDRVPIVTYGYKLVIEEWKSFLGRPDTLFKVENGVTIDDYVFQREVWVL